MTVYDSVRSRAPGRVSRESVTVQYSAVQPVQPGRVERDRALYEHCMRTLLCQSACTVQPVSHKMKRVHRITTDVRDMAYTLL